MLAAVQVLDLDDTGGEVTWCEDRLVAYLSVIDPEVPLSLIDFGVPVDEVLAALPLLDELRQLANVSEDELAEA